MTDSDIGNQNERKMQAMFEVHVPRFKSMQFKKKINGGYQVTRLAAYRAC